MTNPVPTEIDFGTVSITAGPGGFELIEMPGLVADVINVEGFGIDASGNVYFDSDGNVPASEQAYLALDDNNNPMVVR